MRKIILFFIALIALFMGSNANAELRYGPMVGVDITNLKFSQNNIFQVDQRVGGTAGIFTEIMIPGIGFGIDAGLLYTLRGAKLHLDEAPVFEDGTRNCMLHYIEIPLNLRFKYKISGLDNIVSPFAFVGPSFSILAAKTNIPSIDYKSGDVALNVGLGAELFTHWQIAGSYSWGMTDALKTKQLNKFHARNRTWKFTIAYLF